MSKKSHGDRAILRRPYEHRANSDRTVPVTHNRSICDRCITTATRCSLVYVRLRNVEVTISLACFVWRNQNCGTIQWKSLVIYSRFDTQEFHHHLLIITNTLNGDLRKIRQSR